MIRAYSFKFSRSFALLCSRSDQVVPTDLCCLVLSKTHRLLLVQSATRVEVVHLKAAWPVGDAVSNEYLWRVLPIVCTTIGLHGAQLGVARAARFHMR